MLKQRIMLLLLLLGMHNVSIAGLAQSSLQYTIYLGLTQAHIRPEPLLFQGEDDLLVADRHRENQLTWGIGVARDRPTPESNFIHDMSIGLNLFRFTSRQRGATWQYQLPDYNNFNYRLAIGSTRVMADSEITFNSPAPRLFPFVEAALGIAHNKASYSDKPIPNFGGTGTYIPSDTHFDTAFSLGAGIKFLLCDYLTLSLRYRYTNLGYAETSTVSTIPLVSPLNIKLTTQDWLIGLTYSV